ncbi:phage tail protein [Halalkalibacterium halodurans]|jgi:phage-related protein|uniref:Phage-related protein n=1 Tax=Halalkalibacterium halodurans TaxID=86665 RepID=A0A0M0KDK7_ALKHA|nr:hypothetical protein [Halalkalibacterium halodurans]MED4164348.1 hypothetical protein [Halalkalibacterium halodurans]TPE66379.1 hypothetical protein AMD02_019075 [Halalkalibacterium halodurans]
MAITIGSSPGITLDFEKIQKDGKVFQDLASNLGNIKTHIQEINENLANGQFGTVFLGMVGTIGTLIVSFALLGQSVEIFRGIFESLKSPIAPLTIGLIKFIAIAGIIIAVVAGIAAGLMHLWKTNEGFRDTVLTVWETIQRVITTVLNEVVSFISEKLEMIKQFWNEHGDAIKQAVSNVFNAIWAVIQPIMDMILAIMQFVWPFVRELIIGVWNNIKGVIDGALSFIMGLIKTFTGLFTGDFSLMWEGLKQMFMGALQFIWNLIQLWLVGRVLGILKVFIGRFIGPLKTMWSNVRGIFSTGLNAIRNFFTNIFNSIRSTVGTIMNSIRTTIQNGINAAVQVVMGFFSRFREAGRNIVTSIADGIRSAIGAVTGAISSVTSKIRNFLPFSPAKEGPLQDIHRLNFGGPIRDSIDGDLPEIQSSLTRALHVPDVGIGQVGSSPLLMRLIKSLDALGLNGNHGMLAGAGSEKVIIEVPVHLEGKEVARVTAPYMDTELGKRRISTVRARGGR